MASGPAKPAEAVDIGLVQPEAYTPPAYCLIIEAEIPVDYGAAFTRPEDWPNEWPSLMMDDRRDFVRTVPSATSGIVSVRLGIVEIDRVDHGGIIGVMRENRVSPTCAEEMVGLVDFLRVAPELRNEGVLPIAALGTGWMTVGDAAGGHYFLYAAENSEGVIRLAPRWNGLGFGRLMVDMYDGSQKNKPWRFLVRL